MDFYTSKQQAIEYIDSVIYKRKETPIVALNIKILKMFGFGKTFILNYLKDLEEAKIIKLENSTVINPNYKDDARNTDKEE